MITNFFNTFTQICYRLAYRILLCLWFFTRPTVNGVYIAVWHKDRILIIKNSYKRRYTIPCGRIKRQEALNDAAVRELYEEVRIQTKASQLTFMGKYATQHKYAHDIGHFFEVNLPNKPDFKVDQREVVWARFMTLAEALALELNITVRAYLEDR